MTKPAPVFTVMMKTGTRNRALIVYRHLGNTIEGDFPYYFAKYTDEDGEYAKFAISKTPEGALSCVFGHYPKMIVDVQNGR